MATTTSTTSTTSKPGIGRFLRAGLISGVVAAVLANIGLLVLNNVLNRGDQYANVLNIGSITAICLLTSLIGSVLFYFLVRWFRPTIAVAIFVTVAMLVAIGNSVMVGSGASLPAGMPTLNPGFADIANPLHFLVALTATIVIPLLTVGRQNRTNL